ncbi:Hypothetical protein CINCED_3A011765 [Cinara cedri]|uniref:Uncharacterized protein n=1 Tax=Cinara cedri TaxID=506608 RepID=A0A5E4MRV6_9HEMI|nr:Hypothetical protein CINCED_3A011765 [Cinara cedri]
MHNGNISDEKVKELNEFARNDAQMKFKSVFWKLTNPERTQYILETRGHGSVRSMMSILTAIKDEHREEKERKEAIVVFQELLEDNTVFAFRTLSHSYFRYSRLFEDLFAALGAYKTKYKQHLEAETSDRELSILKNLFSYEASTSPLQMNIPAQGVASSGSDTISDEKIEKLNELASRRSIRNLREALSALTEPERHAYIHIITGEGTTIRRASNLLKAMKEEATLIFQQWLSRDDKKFAFAVLTDIHDYSGLYKVLFAELGAYENEYMQYLQQQNTTVASNILKNCQLYTASTSALPESTTNATPQVDTTARKRARHEEEIPVAHHPAALGNENRPSAKRET